MQVKVVFIYLFLLLEVHFIVYLRYRKLYCNSEKVRFFEWLCKWRRVTEIKLRYRWTSSWGTEDKYKKSVRMDFNRGSPEYQDARYTPVRFNIRSPQQATRPCPAGPSPTLCRYPLYKLVSNPFTTKVSSFLTIFIALYENHFVPGN
jgi:hypothetical protein